MTQCELFDGAGHDGPLPRTSQDCSQATGAEILLPWLEKWLGVSSVYRETDGKIPEWLAGATGLSSGQLWTRNFSESRNAAAACFLSEILETGPVDRRYFLSAKACAGDIAPSREAGKVAPTIPSRSTAGGGLGTDFDCDGGLIPQVANPLTARMHKGVNTTCDEGQTMIAHTLRGDGFDASEDGTGRGTPLVPVSVALRGRDGGATAEIGDDLAFALRASSGGGDKPHVMAFAENQRAEITLNDTAGSLKVGGGKPGQGYPAVMQAMQVRRLTCEECEKLQGFPPGYTDLRHNGKPAPDGSRYKALGNSFAVPVVRWIGEQIERVVSA